MLNVGQITIIGTGLLGGSVALAVRGKGFNGKIAGVGRSSATVKRAESLGCWDRLTTDMRDVVGKETDSELVIVAAPLGHFEEIFTKLAACQASATVTDVGSTKKLVCDMARRLLPDRFAFVGSHPMAGSEQQGPEAAAGDLFDGKPCILTPEEDTDPAALSLVEALWHELGMTLIRMTPAEHDRKSAVISHLPHAASVLLAQIAGELGGLEIASTGFAGMTRLASSNPPMRADIMTTNREQLTAMLDVLSEKTRQLRDMIAGGDDVALLKLLAGVKKMRDDWQAHREGE